MKGPFMIRRILTAALGGILGVALILTGLAVMHAPWLLFYAKLWIFWLWIAVACGGFTMWLGEKLRIVPTDEELNRKLGPIRLFEPGDLK
jgi:hypothetical protein